MIEKDPCSWEEFENYCDKIADSSSWMYKRLIVFMYCFPIIDAKVITEPKHLNKLPFSVHQSTGNIAIPLEMDEEGNIDDLDKCVIKYEHIMYADKDSSILNKFGKSIDIINAKTECMKNDNVCM